MPDAILCWNGTRIDEQTLNKIELIVECANCSLMRKKSYLWLREKHLPCPRCGNAFEVNNAHIAIVDMRMREALQAMDNVYGTTTITLKV